MTTTPPTDELIFAYLDGQLESQLEGQLDAQQSVEFEAILASDPSIQKRIDHLNSINESIHRIALTPPRTIPFTQSTKAKPNRIKWIAYAAIIAIAAPLVVLLNQPVPQRTIDAQRFYLQTTTDFEPDIVCDTPEKFESYTTEAFGKTIAADFDTPIQLVGWKYFSKNYTPEELKDKTTTRALVAQTPDGTALLAIFPTKDFSKIVLESGSNMHLHTRSINSIKVIEISPYEDPILLDLLSKK